MRFRICYSNESITGWFFMLLGFNLFGAGIALGGYMFLPGFAKEISSKFEFLNAEQVDSILFVVAFFGGLTGLSLKVLDVSKA